MKDHLSKEQVAKYSQRILPAIELIQADEHLSRCELCREHLIQNSRAVIFSLNQEFSTEKEEEQHLTFEQLADYVDEKENVDRSTMERHLESCAQCTAEVNDLRGFRSTLPSPGRVLRFRKFTTLATLAAVFALLALATAVVYRFQIKGLNQELQQANSRINQLESENRQLISKDAPIVAGIQDGPARITLDAKGNLKGIDTASVSDQQILRAALQNNEIPVSNSVKDLITKSGTVLGAESGLPFALKMPVGTVVAEDNPTFQWESLPSAEKYRVAIFDRAMNAVADSGWIEGTAWSLPTHLRRGERYIWQVKALQKGREVLSPQAPAGEARFVVLDKESFDHVQLVRKKYPDSHLLPALIAAEYGMLDEAEKHLQSLMAMNPDSKEVNLLMQKIQALRPHKGEGSPVTTKPAQ